ncbi:CppA N-terminal domain-containing protein [uncultured Streptococcus sp.]|jgi:C3-degrading proteinase, putative|uniref:CppA N-terminal domain-containing protein n=1 Tax=uncultured Streptococcus sp. TaxID=83427 RepID=UPI0028D0C629|nr:CppA N-terminal domain-containing protein [uncultured Streptococcus sp.]
MSVNHVARIVPVIKVNNRNLNQDFYSKTLGMKSLLEEGAQLSLGDQTKTERLILEESPSMRSRRVKGAKKLARLVIKVAQASEIEALLARGIEVDSLYRGEKGYAFEATSPEGDHILLHAEENLSSLQPVQETPAFEGQDDFIGLSQFDVEKIELRVPDLQAVKTFYQPVSNVLDFLDVQEAKGEDLTADNTKTWDLAMLKCLVTDFDVEKLSSIFATQEFFVPKSKKFLVSQDQSNIELWFEQL